MSLLTSLGLACFASALLLAVALPVQWASVVPVPLVVVGLVLLVWGEARRGGRKKRKRDGKYS